MCVSVGVDYQQQTVCQCARVCLYMWTINSRQCASVHVCVCTCGLSTADSVPVCTCVSVRVDDQQQTVCQYACVCL